MEKIEKVDQGKGREDRRKMKLEEMARENEVVIEMETR